MSLLDKESVKRVAKLLKVFDDSLKVIVLDNSARTAKDAATSLDCEIGAIIKSLLFKNEKGYSLCLISGDNRCSLKKLKKIKRQKNILMASPEEVKAQTGYTIGGVSPIGHINNVEIFIDKSLDRFEYLFAAAGHPNCVFKIGYKEIKAITNGIVEDIIE
jgi:Cys-tRNA(Pro) deacylase